MHLTLHADYSLRVLIYLALHPDRRVSTAEMSQAYGVSLSHLVKVVHGLGQLGFIKTHRGRGGGNELGHPPEKILIGKVLRKVEPDFDLVQCFVGRGRHCALATACPLENAMHRAQAAFLAELDAVTLADVTRPEAAGLMRTLLADSSAAQSAAAAH